MASGVKRNLEIMFLHEKPAKLITRLKGQKNYASILAKEVDCTYSHCVRILQDMKKLGLVDFEKKGRIKLVGLTQLGEDVAFSVENVYRVFAKAE
jgi:Mn-dependent DtxR family transcriptional regulator